MRSGSCLRQQTPPMILCRSKNRESSIALPVVLAVILLPVIAFASPPDPSWIAGIYDGADRDEIVNLVYETWAASAAGWSHIGPSPSMSGILIERITPRLPGSRFAQAPRAPPAVGSKVSVHGFTFRACSTLTASCTKLPLLARRSASSEFGQEDGRKVADVFPTCGPSIGIGTSSRRGKRLEQPPIVMIIGADPVGAALVTSLCSDRLMAEPSILLLGSAKTLQSTAAMRPV